VIALVEASPPALSRRMQVLQSRLSGEDRLTVSVQPSAQVQQWQACPQIAEARLWTLPFAAYRVIALRERDAEGRPPQDIELTYLLVSPLRTGRIHQFRGLLGGAGDGLQESGASIYYAQSRPPDEDLDPIRDRFPEEHLAAIARGKQTASYWLGIVSFERELYEAAVGHFEHRCLESDPDGPWTAAVHYNLGRAYEALGQTDKAVEQYHYEDSPQRHGNLLRARWLEQTQSAAQASAVRGP
jgi:hypothetical protein